MREVGPMRSGLVRSVAVLAMVLALPAASQDGGNIALGVGTQKVLTVPGFSASPSAIRTSLTSRRSGTTSC